MFTVFGVQFECADTEQFEGIWRRERALNGVLSYKNFYDIRFSHILSIEVGFWCANARIRYIGITLYGGVLKNVWNEFCNYVCRKFERAEEMALIKLWVPVNLNYLKISSIQSQHSICDGRQSSLQRMPIVWCPTFRLMLLNYGTASHTNGNWIAPMGIRGSSEIAWIRC